LSTNSIESERCSTGLEKLNEAIGNGIPRGALILVAGNAGSGKTTFCCHFLDQGLKNGEAVIYVSLAESESQFRANFTKMGFDFSKSNNLLTFMELFTGTQVATENYLGALLEKIRETKAKRVVIDSFSALAQSLNSPGEIRQILHTVFEKIVKLMGVTTIVISEIPLGTSRLGVGIEEFVADGIIVLEANFDSTRGRYNRSLKIEKMRGTQIKTQEFAYSLNPNGIALFKKEIMDYPNKTSTQKIPIGCPGLDKMLGGGYFAGTLNLVSGATGSGKSIFFSEPTFFV
jgi:circadian clock protein KaiC